MTFAVNMIIVTGLIFILFGIIGLFKFKRFFPRILVTSKIDTVGAITLIIGLIIKHGISFFSLKLVMILLLLLLLNPLTGHIIARCAFVSDIGSEDEYDDGKGGI